MAVAFLHLWRSIGVLLAYSTFPGAERLDDCLINLLLNRCVDPSDLNFKFPTIVWNNFCLSPPKLTTTSIVALCCQRFMDSERGVSAKLFPSFVSPDRGNNY